MGGKKKVTGRKAAAAAVRRGRYAPEGGGTIRKGRKKMDDILAAIPPPRRKVILAAGVVVALALAALLLVLPRPVTVLLLDENPMLRNAFEAVLSDPAISAGKRFAFETPAPESSFVTAVAKWRKPDLVIGVANAAFRAAAAKYAPASETAARRTPSVLRNLVAVDGRRAALPLLVDHFELATRVGTKGAGTSDGQLGWDAFLTLARDVADPGRPSLFVAGGDDGTLLLLVGAMVDALGGPVALEELSDELASGSALTDIIELPIGDTRLRTVLDLLVALRREGVLHPEWFRMRFSDVAAFMKADRAPFVLMRLSEHRTVPLPIIRGYEAGLFPAGRDAGRVLQAPVIVGAVPEGLNTRRKTAALALLERLLSDPVQKRLGDATGLSPASAAAEALDAQASDVRLWVAASGGASPGLGLAAFVDPAAASAFAVELRAYIEAEGVGY